MLKLENLKKTFNPGTINEKIALDGVDLLLEDGEFVPVYKVEFKDPLIYKPFHKYPQIWY